jgi:subtilisin family serine protease
MLRNVMPFVLLLVLGAIAFVGRPLTRVSAAPVVAGGNLIDLKSEVPGWDLVIAPVKDRGTYFEGERIEFHVRSTRDCYVFLFAINPDGKGGTQIDLLKPAKADGADFTNFRQVALKAGERLLLTRENADGTRGFLIAPPHGPCVVRVVASTRQLKLDANAIKALKEGKGIPADSKATIASDGEVTPNDEKPDDKPGADEPAAPALESVDLAQLAREGVIATAEVVYRTAERSTGGNDGSVGDDVTGGEGSSELTQLDPNDTILESWLALRDDKATGATFRGPRASRGNVAPPRRAVIYRKPAGAKGVGSFLDIVDNATTVNLPADPDAKAAGEVMDIDAYRRQLKAQDPTVVAVLPPVELIPFAGPSDRIRAVQWNLHNRVTRGADIGYTDSVARLADSIKPVLVGVIDTGIAVDDPSLADALWVNPREKPGNGIDDDNNGYVDDVHGMNPFTKNGVLFPSTEGFESHGAICSSIIGARYAGGRLDFRSIAPNAKIITAVALPDDESWSENANGNEEFKAIAYAVRYGAKVLNMSWGFSPSKNNWSEETIKEYINHPAWEALREEGVILVVAAGNDDCDIDQTPLFPAALPYDNVITVMAIDPAGKLGRVPGRSPRTWVQYSCWGQKSVDIAAPGSLIMGIPGKGQRTIDYGTSFAAPHVTAAAALVWGQHPDWTYKQVRDAILKSARPMESLKGKCATEGLLNLEAALSYAP